MTPDQRGDAPTSECCPGPVRLVFQGASSRRSQSNEGSLWRYQSLISANSFAPTAGVVRASFPLSPPECLSEERIIRATFAHLSLPTARARAPGGARVTAKADGPTAVIVRRLGKNNIQVKSAANSSPHLELIMSIHGAISLAAIQLLALMSAASAADINIAVAGPMTGSNAALGAQMRDGVAAAVDDLNASGLLPGTKVVLSVADDACDPKQAVVVANRLASDQVKLVVGHFCSSSSIPASNVYDEAQLVQISPGSTNPALTERGIKSVFRICGRDDQQGVVAAEYIRRHFPNTNIAVLDDRSTAGKGIADVVWNHLRELGMSDVKRQSYVAGEKDYMALVSRMKADGINLAYIGGYYNEVGLIVRQASEAGADITVMANDPLMTHDFSMIAGKAGNGTLFTFMPDPTKNADAANVVARLKASNRSAEGYSLYAYAAVQAWAKAAKRAGTFDSLKVAATLRSQPIDTVIGVVRFDAKGDNSAPGFIVYRWQDNIVEQAE